MAPLENFTSAAVLAGEAWPAGGVQMESASTRRSATRPSIES